MLKCYVYIAVCCMDQLYLALCGAVCCNGPGVLICCAVPCVV